MAGIVNALMDINMTPIKRHQNGHVIDIIQWVGLILLIGFTYRHFGRKPARRSPRPSLAFLALAVFLLLGPIPLKFKE